MQRTDVKPECIREQSTHFQSLYICDMHLLLDPLGYKSIIAKLSHYGYSSLYYTLFCALYRFIFLMKAVKQSYQTNCLSKEEAPFLEANTWVDKIVTAYFYEFQD
jgi:hypothetical protein